MSAVFSVLVPFLTGAAYTDALKGKIYNFWLMPAYLTGIMWNIMNAGLSPPFCTVLVKSFLYPFLVFLVFYPIWYFHGLSAGDIKLLMVLSVWLSPCEFQKCTFISLLLGILFGIPAVYRDFSKKEFLSSRHLHRIHFALPVFCSFLLHLGGLF